MGNARSLGTWNGQIEGFTLFLFILSLMQLTNGPLQHWVSGIYTYLINKYTYNNIKVKIMKKKNYLLLATAAIALVACTADDDLSAGKSTTAQGDGAIMFNMGTSATTRAAGDPLTGSDAAGKLGNKFIVWGEKNEVDASKTSYAATDPTTVFKNYVVSWAKDTKNTTNSNTHDWEYVGVDHSKYDTYVISTIGSSIAQTIKYWDMNANDYTFTAVSAKEDDIKDGLVKITKTTSSSNDPASVYDKGYKIELKSGASAGNVYVADRVNIAKSKGTTTANEEGKYGGYVNFTFRNFQTKIRFGFYETVPGYTVEVQNVKFNSAENKTNFGVDGTGSFYDIPSNGYITYNVTYETGATGTTENKAKINVDNTSATAANYKQFGDNIFGSALKTTSSDPTYDQTGSGSATYHSILPNPDNASNMSFKISYNLISEDTKEVIEVKDREVVVPAEYCKWKSNYAYTYLFKISDQSADLYPITFDACVVEDETGKQETITEVGGDTKNTSITTFAYDATNKKIVESDKNEYPAGSVIYATVMEGSTNKDLSVDASTGNIKLYTVTTTNATNYPVTEKSVAKALNTAVYTVTGTANIVATEATGATVETSVPAEDGVGTRSISALKWTDANTNSQAGTYYYAIQYKNSANEYCYKVVKVVKSGN